ncbi:MAG: 2Fe-2S iron-sulfur cluster-binding protein [Myxococcota bacterium]
MPKVRFMPDGFVADVPEGSTLLQAAKQCGAPEGDACGGNCACSTCHVYVRQGGGALSEQEDAEADILDKAFAVLPSSRLGCQAKITSSPESEIVVEITQESREAWVNEHPEARHKTG